MKKNILFVLLAVAAFMGCSTADDMPSSANRVWDTSLMASNLGIDIQGIEDFDDGIADNTRSVFIGGQSGSNFIKLWDTNDKVVVYKDGMNVGELRPQRAGNQRSTLSGTLTGSYAEGDELTLYMPSPDLDYTGQDGTIGNMCKYFDYMMTTAKVASIDGTTVITEEVTFSSRQSYLLFKFRDENDKLLHVKQVILYAPSGKLVASKALDGTTTYTEELVITPPKEHKSVDDYPIDIYIAILNENTAKESYSFTVVATNGKTYKSTAPVNTKLTIGKMASSRHAVTCATVDMEVQTAITPPESDEPDVQQVTL